MAQAGPKIPFTAEELRFLQYTESAQQNFGMAMKLLDECFDKCVSKIETKLTSGEVTCLHHCAERFMETRNVVLRKFMATREEQAQKKQGK